MAHNKTNSLTRKNKVDALKLQLIDKNYTSLKNSAFEWIDNASGATVWNAFMIGNIQKIESAYIDNDEFGGWMQKLYAKLEELCKDVRVLRNADRVLPEDDNLLDNQDLCLLFKVSIKTLQRYRAIGALPYFTISGKVYYKASDVREFIKERFSVTTLRQFEKEHCTKKKK